MPLLAYARLPKLARYEPSTENIDYVRGLSIVDRGGYGRYVRLHGFPVIAGKHKHCKRTAGKLLLVHHLLIVRHKNVKSGRFDKSEKATVLDPEPALRLHRRDLMIWHPRHELARHTFVKQDLQG